MYGLSITHFGFQAVMTEEMSEKVGGLHGVVSVLPDPYLYPDTNEYGGDKYENGVITSRLLLPLSQLVDSPGKHKQCQVVIGDANALLTKIGGTVSDFSRRLDKFNLKRKYDKDFRHRLISRCLVLPEPINSRCTEFLHSQHHLVNSRIPEYLSSYELMVQRERIKDDDVWDHFWNYIVTKRVFIVENWDTNIGNVEILNYDYGIKGFYKGEVDASYHDGKEGNPGIASLSFVLFKGDELECAKVFRDITCPSIHAAEAYAVLALFFHCLEQGIEDLVLWNDNHDIHGCVTGAYTVGHDNNDRDVLLSLGCMDSKFHRLIPLWKPRQLLFLPDYLTQGGNIPLTMGLEKKFAYQLSGKSIFKLSLAGPLRQIIKKFGKIESIGILPNKYFMEVDGLHKLDALAAVTETLSPVEVHLAIHQLKKKPEDYLNRISAMTGENLRVRNKDIEFLSLGTKGIRGTIGKNLLVVMDSAVPKNAYEHLGYFTIIFVSPGERTSLDPDIQELSALSYVSFKGVQVSAKAEGVRGNAGRKR